MSTKKIKKTVTIHLLLVRTYGFCFLKSEFSGKDSGGAAAASLVGVHGAVAGRRESGDGGVAQGCRQGARAGRGQGDGGGQREGHRAGPPRRASVRRHLHAP